MKEAFVAVLLMALFVYAGYIFVIAPTLASLGL